MNLSNNKIVDLPMKLGTLPSLRRNLSQNCIGNFYRNGWLKKAAVRNTLFFLDISHNLVSTYYIQLLR